MKTIYAFIAAVALLVGVSANAQVPTYFANQISTNTLLTTYSGQTGTNYLTLTNYPVLDVRKQQTVALQFNVQMSGACDSNMTYTLAKSVDNVDYDTVNTISIPVPANGATKATFVTNITVGGYGYLALIAVTNPKASVTLTNTIKWGTKISSP